MSRTEWLEKPERSTAEPLKALQDARAAAQRDPLGAAYQYFVAYMKHTGRKPLHIDDWRALIRNQDPEALRLIPKAAEVLRFDIAAAFQQLEQELQNEESNV